MQHELDDLCIRIYGHAGCEFNINSPKQLADVLFTKMSLQPTRRTRTKEISTAREVLEELALIHEMPALVLRWREIQKLKGTYVDALPGLVNVRTGRVHTTFNQAVAATGRLSRPGGSAAATRICRTSRFEPHSVARFAPLSSRSPVIA
jgi:DNA polymerase-1